MGARLPRRRRDVLETGAPPPGVTAREMTTACLLFALATVLLSYPLALSPASTGRLDNGDARLNAWAISWVAHQLVHDPLSLFEANTFYPLRRSLAYSEHLTLQGFAALPLLAATDDLVLTNNLLLLFSMFACAFGMYWLVVLLTGSHLAGVLAGLFFSFAPFRFNRLPHLQVQLYAFIPLFLACLHRFLDTRRRLWLLLMAGAFVLQALSGTYLGAMGAVALAVALCTLLPFSSPTRAELVWVAATLAGAAILLLPFALPYLWVHRELGVEWELSGMGSLSATPQSYLASSSHLYRGLSEAFLPRGTVADFLFPGLSLLALGVAGFFLLITDGSRRPIAVCYGSILLVGVVLSLGPSTPVHALLYEHVVFFRGLRALTRFGLLPLLSLSVLSGFALAWLFEGSGRLRRRNEVAAAIGLFFVAESTALPYRFEPFRDEPAPVYRWLAHAKPGPIVELPFKVVDTRYMFWARHHDFRPMLNGDSGFIPMSHQWMKVALGRFPSDDSIALLRRLRVRYVVLHLGAFRKPALLRLLRGIDEHRDALLPVRDFGRDLVFEVTPPRTTAEIGPPGESLVASGRIPKLFDGETNEPWAAREPVAEVDVELEHPASVTGIRLHYGPVPRTPVIRASVFPRGENAGESWTSRSDWPAVTELVEGLIRTPLDGTQTLTFAPLEGTRFRLRLEGIDGRPPELTEIELLGRALLDEITLP